MAYQVRISDRASRDLEAIYDFIEADSSEAAFVWFNDLCAAIYSLEEFAERGATVAEAKGLRQVLFGAKPNVYRIIYGVDKRRRAVNVVHIRHGARAAFADE